MTREGMLLALGFAALCALAAGLMLRDLERPGLYYDEVIQAEPAVQFLSEGGRPSQIPGLTATRLLGGWLPLMTQPYMGALKSQALIPVFALFGASPATLRATTLAWTLLGVLLAMLWARALLGLPEALLAGAFLAVDPSLLFIGRHDWGSFALALVCRCGGFWLVTVGWRRASGPRLLAGGLLLGLGVYNKIDFAVTLAAASLALVLVAPGVVAAAVRVRRVHAVLAAAGFALGAAPMLAALPGAFAVTRAVAGRQALESGDWGEKLGALVHTLDGSYFERLLLAGGSFEELGTVEGAATGGLLVAFALAAVFLGARLARASARDAAWQGRAFVLAAAALAVLGILATPRAVRIHHALNVYPLPQLVVAAGVAELWRAGAARRALRTAAVAVALAVPALSLRVDARTLAAIEASGGKGRWSDALMELAGTLRADPDAVAVSLDWGFHGPLRFAARDLPAVETIWALRRLERAGRGFQLDGTPHHVYLLYPPRYAVFDYGGAFLDAVRQLPAGAAEIRTHRDRAGDAAFLSVRIARPHRVEYRGDRGFEVTLR